MGISNTIPPSRLIQPGVVANTAARPTSPFTGQAIYQVDTNQMLIWNGTAWVIPNSPAQNPTGLEFVKSQTIGTTVSSVNVTSAFSSTYDNYKIIISGGVGSGLSTLGLKLGASVTGYSSGVLYVAYGATTALAASDNGASIFSFAGYATTGFISASLDVINPFAAAATTFGPAQWAAGTVSGISSGIHNIATSYTDFTFIPSTGTLTGGTIYVYGYRK